jgi:anti-sigma-K factor RskA
MALPPPAWRLNATLARLGWALAVCFILVTGILLTQTNRLRGEVARSNERLTNLTRDLAAERRWSVILSSPAMRTASFTLTPDADAGLRARAVMDPGTRRAVLVFEHFRAPEGKVYELWALHENTPVSMGRIRPDASGSAVMRIEDVGDPNDLTAFTISLEAEGPAAGNEPAGPIVMIGSLGG